MSHVGKSFIRTPAEGALYLVKPMGKVFLFLCLYGYFADQSSQAPSSACDLNKHITGPRGLPGPVGPSGLPGIVGPPGPPGHTGADGRMGNPGPIGEKGLPGPQGIKGEKGNAGLQGRTGKAGPIGKFGQKGNKGSQGLPGPVGPKGNIGHKGQKGERGAQGVPGVFSKDEIKSLWEKVRDIEQSCQMVSCDCGCLQKKNPNALSGIYRIFLVGLGFVSAYCDMETDGGGWTVFQRRKDGSVSFDRGWKDYESGFGNFSSDYWLGLALLHHLLQLNERNELRVDLEDYSGNKAHAKYSRFSVGNSASKYQLSVNGYHGTAGDALDRTGVPQGVANGMKFSTIDQDSDDIEDGSCAADYKGGWWFRECYRAFLNGAFGRGLGWNGIVWYNWKQKNESLKFSEMKFRKA